MYNLSRSILVIIFISVLQLCVYDIFLKPIITTWGASAQEVSMPMAGDDENLTIISTRAILINARKDDVWQWLIQLGADRGGFYSYYFIEKFLGYETRHQDVVTPEFKQIAVGDLVRGSIDEQASIIPYNFPVRYVTPGETFVLENWGTFLLQEVNPQQTRLIIRTQEPKSASHFQNIMSYIVIPLHFLMERRTLIGIKERVEAGENAQLSNMGDIWWFWGVVLSGIIIYVLVFVGRGIVQCILIPCVFSICWLLALLLWQPIPLYSVGLLLVECGYIVYRYISSKNTN